MRVNKKKPNREQIIHKRYVLVCEQIALFYNATIKLEPCLPMQENLCILLHNTSRIMHGMLDNEPVPGEVMSEVINTGGLSGTFNSSKAGEA